MVLSEMKASMVIAGRGARACDMCGKERAKWYCAADDAYLCERCDGSVHSANAVAKRHERVRIGHHGAPVKLQPSHHTNHHHHHDDTKTKSNKSTLELENSDLSLESQKRDVQTWCTTSRKRKRTPRRGSTTPAHLISSHTPTVNLKSCNSATIKEEKDDTSDLLLYDLLTEDDQLCSDLSGTAPFKIKSEPFSPSSTLTSGDFAEVKTEGSDFAHEVPTYEPLLQDLIACGDEAFMEKLMPSSPSLCNVSCSSGTSTSIKIEANSPAEQQCKEVQLEAIPFNHEAEPLHMYDLVDSSGGDINEGVSIDEDSDIDTFDVMDLCSNATFDDNIKADNLKEGFPDMEMWKCAYRLNQEAGASIFEGNPFKGKGEKDLDFGCVQDTDCLQGEDLKPPLQCAQQPRPLSLHLDYEDVINTWSDRGSLWMDGQRPQLVPDINFLDHGGVESGMVMVVNSSCHSILRGQAGQVPSLVVVDKAREARVLRYKEKRRNRLFSKKIRYEVRKLNAERRPRMKGRFVKRAAIAAIAAM